MNDDDEEDLIKKFMDRRVEEETYLMNELMKAMTDENHKEFDDDEAAHNKAKEEFLKEHEAEFQVFIAQKKLQGDYYDE